MKTIRLFSISLTTLIVLTFSQQTVAQMANFYSSPGYSNFISTLINNKIWEASMKNYTRNYRGRSGTPRSSSSRSSVSAAIPEIPAYRRYPAVQFKSTGTRVTLQEYLDALVGTPQDKAEAKELVLKNFKEYESEAAAKGYPNDWALAYVSFVGLNSHVYNGKTEQLILPFEQNIGLRDVVAEYATDHGIFNNVTDRKKQELYEVLVMFGGLTYRLYEKALRENNFEELKQLKLAAAQNLKLVGINP